MCLDVWFGIGFCGFLLHLKPWDTVLGLEVEKLTGHLLNCVHYLLLTIFTFYILFLVVFPVISFNA